MGALINKDGIIISSSESGDINKESMLSSEDLVKLASNKVVFTNIIWESNEENKNMIIAVPIFFNNKYQGAMVNVINMDYFENIVNDVSFFENGKIVVMDGNGAIASSNSENLKENINKISLPNNLYEEWEH